MARNSSDEAQIVSSLVFVRNSLPSTPTKSPKSSSLKMAKSRSGQRVLPDVDLDLRAAVRDHEEVGLAEAADRQDAPGGPRLDRRGLELLRVFAAVRRDQIARSCRSARTCADTDRHRAARAPRSSRAAGAGDRIPARVRSCSVGGGDGENDEDSLRSVRRLCSRLALLTVSALSAPRRARRSRTRRPRRRCTCAPARGLR